MSDYRRLRVDGATVFFTVTLAERGSDLLTREIEALRDAVRNVRAAHPFRIEAWVVMPDHLHAVWTLPKADADYSVRWGAIKAGFVMKLRLAGYSPPTTLPRVASGRFAGLKPGLWVEKREVAVWQRRFWEHHIRDERDFQAHAEYCWFNPVKHGFVEDPADWPNSSYHRDRQRFGM